MKKIILQLLLVITSIYALTLPAQAQWIRSKRATEREQATKGKADTAYKELFKGTHVQKAAGDLMTLHSVDRKVLIEMPLDKLNTDMLVAATVSSVSTPQLGITGFRNMYPLHIQFARKGKQVVMEVVNRVFLFDKEKMPHLSESQRTNFGNISLMKFEIAGYSPDSTVVVFDASDLFLNDNRWFPVTQATVGSFRASHNIKPTLSRVAALKSFSDNASVKVERTYSVTLTASSGRAALSNYPATFGVTFSFLKLPKQPMVPRLSDTRVGVFQNSRVVIDTLSHRIAETTFVNRWRIEPADTTAYLAGQLTPPTKPIVFYIDTAFPEEWKEPIRRDVLRWNKSFERIGFKDVVRVQDFPSDDPEFDPDNLKYNCLRYIPVDIENAMGPSLTDPRSGEIINASVFVYSNVTSLNHAWRFVQTAQLDPTVRSRKLPQDVLDRTLEYVIAHEIGHCLGFMHNMALLGGSKLALSYYLDDKSYTPSEFIDDLYAFVFAKTIAGNEDLSHAERELQKGFVENIGRTVAEQSKSARAYALTQVTELEQQISRMLAASNYSCCGAHRFGAAHHHHDAEQGDSVHKQLATTSIGFGTGYGNPSDLFMSTVEGVTSYMLAKSFDAKALLEQAVERTRDPELKLHYRFLLDRLKRAAK